jgi:hypothetical protein
MTSILVVDVGGTNIKVSMAGRRAPIKIPLGQDDDGRGHGGRGARSRRGLEIRRRLDWLPGSVKHGRPAHEPHNLSGGWMCFNYGKAFGAPVKIVNDAAMQPGGLYCTPKASSTLPGI